MCFFSSRYYILNYNTIIEFEEVCIPIEDIKLISNNKNKISQQICAKLSIEYKRKKKQVD